MHDQCQCEECKAARKCLHIVCNCQKCEDFRKEHPKWRPREEIAKKPMEHAGTTERFLEHILEVMLDTRDMMRTQDARLSDIRDALIEMGKPAMPWTPWYPPLDTGTWPDTGPTNPTWKYETICGTSSGFNCPICHTVNPTTATKCYGCGASFTDSLL